MDSEVAIRMDTLLYIPLQVDTHLFPVYSYRINHKRQYSVEEGQEPFRQAVFTNIHAGTDWEVFECESNKAALDELQRRVQTMLDEPNCSQQGTVVHFVTPISVIVWLFLPSMVVYAQSSRWFSR